MVDIDSLKVRDRYWCVPSAVKLGVSRVQIHHIYNGLECSISVITMIGSNFVYPYFNVQARQLFFDRFEAEVYSVVQMHVHLRKLIECGIPCFKTATKVDEKIFEYCECCPELLLRTMMMFGTEF